MIAMEYESLKCTWSEEEGGENEGTPYCQGRSAKGTDRECQLLLQYF